MRYFVMCPAYAVTGGTELLHQFCWHLNNKGIECYMLYKDAKPDLAPSPDAFLKYQVKAVTCFVDDSSSVLVLPETMIDSMSLCKKGTTVIWWLSAENYMLTYKMEIQKQNKMDIFGLAKNKSILHFVQSKYAFEFVKKQFDVERITYLSDYINDDIVDIALRFRRSLRRENICLYNPRKGYENLVEIQKMCRGDIQWIALTGMSPDQLALLMCRAKVYIDFGWHPGKDRIPREAAVCGCCIITNREGSAAYAEDVGIPEKYKIADMKDCDRVLGVIYDLMDNYDEKIGEYEEYAASVLAGKAVFEKEIDEMLEIVSRIYPETVPMWKGNAYDTVIENMRLIVSRIDASYKNVRELYAVGEIDMSVSELLKVEGCLSALREAGYMVINDMLTGE